MSEPFIGEIRLFAGNFAPRGWAFCEGQLLPISQNTALFSLLGTTYGGDGRSTVGLPDLRGRTAIHPGNGPGLPPRVQGDTSYGNSETRAIVSNVSKLGRNMGYVSTQRTVSAAMLDSNESAYSRARIGMNFIIALTGLYPSRS